MGVGLAYQASLRDQPVGSGQGEATGSWQARGEMVPFPNLVQGSRLLPPGLPGLCLEGIQCPAPAVEGSSRRWPASASWATGSLALALQGPGCSQAGPPGHSPRGSVFQTAPHQRAPPRAVRRGGPKTARSQGDSPDVQTPLPPQAQWAAADREHGLCGGSQNLVPRQEGQRCCFVSKSGAQEPWLGVQVDRRPGGGPWRSG